MRKMMNKKGFTLVELMIVVVILGILVAIAVPIYSAVTTNAQRKACNSNMRIIRSNLSSYLLGATDENGTTRNLAAGDTLAVGSSIEVSIKGTFDKGAVPKCTNKVEATAGVTYQLVPTAGTQNFKIKCVNNKCPNYNEEG